VLCAGVSSPDGAAARRSPPGPSSPFISIWSERREYGSICSGDCRHWGSRRGKAALDSVVTNYVLF
jgi:hypothetical protein